MQWVFADQVTCMFHKQRKIGETKDLVNYAIFAKLYLPRILAYSIFDEFATNILPPNRFICRFTKL